jgi:hypothetical protein
MRVLETLEYAKAASNNFNTWWATTPQKTQWQSSGGSKPAEPSSHPAETSGKRAWPHQQSMKDLKTKGGSFDYGRQQAVCKVS